MLQKKESKAASFRLFDTVRLRETVSQKRISPWGGDVNEGALGTIVEELPDGFFLVEFGEDSEEPAVLTLPASSLALRWSSRS